LNTLRQFGGFFAFSGNRKKERFAEGRVIWPYGLETKEKDHGNS
jgi:hypothetical protein